MENQDQNNKTCPSCGARMSASMRYCPSCNQKVSGVSGVSGERTGSLHTESAKDIDTTHRYDPTVVFSPEAHEQIKRKTKSQKRLMIASVIVFALFTIALFGW